MGSEVTCFAIMRSAWGEELIECFNSVDDELYPKNVRYVTEPVFPSQLHDLQPRRDSKFPSRSTSFIVRGLLETSENSLSASHCRKHSKRLSRACRTSEGTNFRAGVFMQRMRFLQKALFVNTLAKSFPIKSVNPV